MIRYWGPFFHLHPPLGCGTLYSVSRLPRLSDTKGVRLVDRFTDSPRRMNAGGIRKAVIRLSSVDRPPPWIVNSSGPRGKFPTSEKGVLLPSTVWPVFWRSNSALWPSSQLLENSLCSAIRLDQRANWRMLRVGTPSRIIVLCHIWHCKVTILFYSYQIICQLFYNFR